MLGSSVSKLKIEVKFRAFRFAHIPGKFLFSGVRTKFPEKKCLFLTNLDTLDEYLDKSSVKFNFFVNFSSFLTLNPSIFGPEKCFRILFVLETGNRINFVLNIILGEIHVILR
jgi:hypothetical protein